MMYQELLKASKGLPVKDPIAALWGLNLAATGWEITEITGTLPIRFLAKGGYLTGYRIYGTAEGAGVPTPNLFDQSTFPFAETSTIEYQYIQLEPETDYTLWTDFPNNSTKDVFIKTGQASSVVSQNNGVAEGRPRTVTTSSEGWLTIATRYNTARPNPAEYSYCLQKGSVGSYIPYGYKLPLTVESGAQSRDIPIYIGDSKLGEEEYVDYGEQKVYKRTEIKGLSEPLRAIGDYADELDLSTGVVTRRIAKYTYNGITDGSWIRIASTTANTIYNRRTNAFVSQWGTTKGLSFVSHYKPVVDSSIIGDYHLGGLTSIPNTRWNGNVVMCSAQASTAQQYQAWLAAQYESGTPVTIWYVVNEPIIEQVTVPAGLSGTIRGYLIYEGTPTESNPIYPIENGTKQQDNTYSVYTENTPTDPPVPPPPIPTYKGENTLSCAEALGEVTVKGRISKTQLYRRVEWIKSTGTQIITTDIQLDYTKKVEMDCAFGSLIRSTESNSHQMICGVADATANASFRVFNQGGGNPGISSNVADITFYIGFNWQEGVADANITYANVVERNVMKAARPTSYWGDKSVAVDQTVTHPGSAATAVFGMWNPTTGDKYPYGRRDMTVYSFKVYDSNDALTNELVPAERIADGELGLLETMANKFYTNAGTGVFEKGGYLD